MPCSDGYSDVERYTELRIRLDKATRAACEMARVIRKYGQALIGDEGTDLFDKLSSKTKGWVKRHDEADRRRIKEEKKEMRRKKLRKLALAKLSHKEREALNLG
jgi:hypothetical protein